MDKISTLAEAHETLGLLGYQATLNEHSVGVKLGGGEHPFAAVITHNSENNHFQITCMMAKLGQVGDDHLTRFAIAALDANSRISPFAYALLTETDNPDLEDEAEWPVVLTHSIPIGDLAREELESAMSSLVAALLDSVNVLGILLEQPTP